MNMFYPPEAIKVLAEERLVIAFYHAGIYCYKYLVDKSRHEVLAEAKGSLAKECFLTPLCNVHLRMSPGEGNRKSTLLSE
jgi:hypothetical protein